MTAFLYRFSDIYLFVFVCLFFVVLSIFAVILVKRTISHELRYADNPVIGSIASLIGIIYGVLAGLTALYLINNINATSDAVNREANAVANIYRDSHLLPEPIKTEVQARVKEYLHYVIQVEWKLMREARKIDDTGDQIIHQIAHALGDYSNVSVARILMLHDMMEEVKSLYNARHERIHISQDSLNAAIWVVIIIGTLLTLMINYLFGMNLFLHILTISAVALMLASMMYLLITLDRPFQGEFAIQPEAMQTVLDFVKKQAT